MILTEEEKLKKLATLRWEFELLSAAVKREEEIDPLSLNAVMRHIGIVGALVRSAEKELGV